MGTRRTGLDRLLLVVGYTAVAVFWISFIAYVVDPDGHPVLAVVSSAFLTVTGAVFGVAYFRRWDRDS